MYCIIILHHHADCYWPFCWHPVYKSTKRSAPVCPSLASSCSLLVSPILFIALGHSIVWFSSFLLQHPSHLLIMIINDCLLRYTLTHAPLKANAWHGSYVQWQHEIAAAVALKHFGLKFSLAKWLRQYMANRKIFNRTKTKQKLMGKVVKYMSTFDRPNNARNIVCFSFWPRKWVWKKCVLNWI